MTDSVATGMPARSTNWNHALVALTGALAALLFFYRDTAVSLVGDWLLYATYTHGFLIVPISLWLVWQKRESLGRISPKPDWAGFVILIVLSTCMSLATLASVKVAQQFSLVAMLIATLWFILGRRVAVYLAFPLLFLFLAVPMGMDLVPPLMEFTASFTVAMLQLTGIPVYREGLFFVIPSGNWSVVEACSGLRYLIASVTLGLLYAYLTYSSFWRRAIFVALSALIPVIANGFRAYLIVMIGHLSDMKLAVGVDHLLYGWVFFGLVMLLLFWVGSFWSQPVEDARPEYAAAPAATSTGTSFYMATLLVLLISTSIATATAKLAQDSPGVAQALIAPSGKNGWAIESGVPWPDLPDTLPTEHKILTTYRKGTQQVALAVSLYPTQGHAADAVSVANRIFVPETGWRLLSTMLDTDLAGAVSPAVNRHEITRSDLPDGAVRLTLLQWYRLGSRPTASDYRGKIYTALNLFYPHRTDGAYIVVAASSGMLDSEADGALASFMKEMGPAINDAIDTAVLGNPAAP